MRSIFKTLIRNIKPSTFKVIRPPTNWVIGKVYFTTITWWEKKLINQLTYISNTIRVATIKVQGCGGKYVWNLKVPPKILILFCLVLHRATAFKTNLQTHGVVFPDTLLPVLNLFGSELGLLCIWIYLKTNWSLYTSED